MERRTRIYTAGEGLHVFWMPESSQLGVANFNGQCWSRKMSQEERIELIGGGLAVTLLEPKWNEVFDEAGLVVEREEDEEERVSLRFGTSCTIDLEKMDSPLQLISNVIGVLLKSYEGAASKRRSTGKPIITKKRGAKVKLPPPTKLVDVKKVSLLNRNMKKRSGPSKGPVFDTDEE
ncbi:hypothetical protein PFISCL1PPCAC_1555 [Pristionchus fissidentatus]|uniref:Uncharacterized protein n=1 Tax=Pristionchus fissidentatus TaxID=1538716 RepID=A0AAV5UVS5_9BILA|nr:hypothetical protein PFISCL1PPCAC_1555 [Pristionchus fissidentatus]